MVEIRTEEPKDSAAIKEVHIRAFGGPVEAKLVQLICERNKALISLVAVSDGKVAGHILFSQVTIANSPDTFSGVGLAPVAVLPEVQRQGIGSKLIREGLERSKQAGYEVVVLIGSNNISSLRCLDITSVRHPVAPEWVRFWVRSISP